MWLGFNAILHVASIPTITAPNNRTPNGSGTWISRLGILDSKQAMDLALPLIEQPELTGWPATFEAVTAAMESDGRIYSEGDGSFVLCGAEATSVANAATYWVGQLPNVSQCLPTSGWRASEVAPREVASREVVWRIEGTVVDGCGWVDHITINGAAPLEQWRQLFDLLLTGTATCSVRQPNHGLVAQLHQFGRYVDLEYWPEYQRSE